MSLLAMPFLVTNLGGEMVFILEQRLHAQNIPKEKSNKASPKSIAQLYDLMTMGFKYQLVTCSHPRELVEVTLNHLESIRASIESSTRTVELVDAAITQMVKLCQEISNAEFAQIRQTLARFFQDKHIKVSLFLQDGIQSTDGTILIPQGGPLYNDDTVEAPGTIRYYNADGEVTSTETFAYPLKDVVGPRLSGDPYDRNTRDSKLGKNIYTIDRTKKKEAAKPSTKHTSSAASTATSSQKLKEIKGAAVLELNGLRDLISAPASCGDFKVANLFGEDSSGPSDVNRDIIITKVTREEMMTINAALVDVMKSLDVTNAQASEQDLLSLMDEASA